MSFRCHNCQAELKADIAISVRLVRCEYCGSLVDTNFLGYIKRNVGIHPALARRYGEMEKSPIPDASTVLQAPLNHSAKKSKSPALRRLENDTDFDQIVPRIPGYELLDCIGKGAMGSVYRAKHLSSGREAAVKVLSPELSYRRDLVARFEREAAALRAFRHPNVVAIFDSGSYGHTHYYGMEYIDGTNLRRFLKNGPLPLHKAVRYLRIILLGIKAAHDRGIIHRDLKPENVLVEKKDNDREERVVLVDFGLAGILNESADPHPNLTRSKVTMGTVNYMAPEQHIDAKRVDFRSDLYACGVILYECITGDLPLGRYLLPSERGINVPPSIDACLSKALARPVGERYQTAGDFEEDLKKIEEELKTFMPAKQQVSSLPPIQTHLSDKSFTQSAPGNMLTSFKTRFASVPMWVKKPTMAYGALALLIGLVAGILVAQRTPNEVVISAKDAKPVYATASFKAPLPVFKNSSNKMQVSDFSFVNEKDIGKYTAKSPVWGFEDKNIVYMAKQGEAGHFRRDLSLLVSPVKVPLDMAMLKGQFYLQKVRLPLSPAKSQHLAREFLGGTPEMAAGGLFYVNNKETRAIGMMVFVDGSCGIAELHRQNDFLRFVQYEKGTCKAPIVTKPMEATFKCDMKSGACQGFLENQKVSEIRVESISSDEWKVALGCRNINCIFRMK